jgi:hypothetical protein
MGLCVFAFRDTYQPGDVPAAAVKEHGRYALVALTLNHPGVVAAFVVDRLPMRFGHLS